MLAGLKEWVKGHPLAYRAAKRLQSLLRLGLALPAALRFVAVAQRARKTIAGAGDSPIVMLVISEVHRDPRVEREARALAAAGFPVRVLYPNYTGVTPAPPIDWGSGISFRALPAASGDFIFRYPYLLGSHFLEAALEEPACAYHCHDLATCIVGLEAARVNGARCVCDFHEWYSENASWDAARQRYRAHPWYARAAYRRAERRVMREASVVLTVCTSIADELEAEHGRTVHVVRNIAPPSADGVGRGADLRAQIGVGADRFVLLYQGGVGPSRYLEPIIAALAQAPRAVFVIRGPGVDRFEPHYRNAAKGVGVADRVFCLPPVPSARVVAEAASADAGIWTLENICKNFRLALPNKIFEYMSAGLPVLAAGYPEARRVVEGAGVGLCFDADSPASIAAALNRLIDEPGLRANCRANIPACLGAHDGAREWAKLVDLYRELKGR